VSRGLVAYVCPPNHFWGAFAILAFRTICCPSGVSKVICCIGNKCFMLHLIDNVTSIFGNQAWSVFRSWERINPPKLAIVNLCLVTLQTLSFGTYLETYREQIFTLAFELFLTTLKWISSIFQWFLILWGRVNALFCLNG
jgi:hypothetical protein